jgi:signal transduction histidine kinase
VARNAERHADNPRVRADMVATLKNSVDKMNDLLARLSQHNRGRMDGPRTVSLRAVADAVAANKRGAHLLHVEGRADVLALADPLRLEQALAHIVQNAIDASEGSAPVTIGVERSDEGAVLTVVDKGKGMSAEFVRSRLFRPFASTKEGGFGIGAYEARTLIMAMGGRLEVTSQEDKGSRFIIVLPEATSDIVAEGPRRIAS